jgi:hypothetical protein
MTVTPADEGGVLWDAPNQQVVRDDHSAPWEEGTGGDTDVPTATGGGDDLDAMTKDDLLAYAQGLGVSPANASMNKADLLAGIKAHQKGGT